MANHVKILYHHVYKMSAFLNFVLVVRGRNPAASLPPLGMRLVRTVVDRMLFVKRL